MEIKWRNAVVKHIRDQKSVYREFVGIVGKWETNGQCVKRDTCSSRHDMNKRGKSSPSNSVSEFFHAAEWAKIIENPKSQRQKSER